MTMPAVERAALGTSDDKVIDLVHRLSAVRDAQEIMDVVRHGAREILGADGVTFVLRDGDFCYYADEDAISPLWKGKRFPINTCVSGWAMQHHETVVMENIYEDDRVPHDAYRLTFVRSMVMVPVRREDPMAAIGAYWAKQHLPTDKQVKALEIIANAAAVALTNVGLIHSLHNMVEELQLRNKELDLAYRAKASFIGNMSHELRTPLNIILGFSEIIRKQVHGAIDKDEYITCAENIQDAGKNLLRIINDVLEMTALGSGLYPLQKQPVQLNEVMESALGLVEKKIRSTPLTLSVSIPGQLPDVMGEQRLLTQVFFNILSNCIKFTPADGHISVVAEKMQNGVSCSITDTGIGMSDEDIEKALRPFQQIDDRLERGFDGTGLGLALCKGYVDLHGGDLAINSVQGKGTTITVTLPVM